MEAQADPDQAQPAALREAAPKAKAKGEDAANAKVAVLPRGALHRSEKADKVCTIDPGGTATGTPTAPSTGNAMRSAVC